MTKLALRYNRISPQMLYWKTEKGVEFLRRVGIKQGGTILGFGCRVGHYTIPVAKTVGSKGIVYAMSSCIISKRLIEKSYTTELPEY